MRLSLHKLDNSFPASPHAPSTQGREGSRAGCLPGRQHPQPEPCSCPSPSCSKPLLAAPAGCAVVWSGCQWEGASGLAAKGGHEHGPRTVLAVVSPALPSSEVALGISGPTLPKHIQEPKQAPGMFETSAHADVLPSPTSINRHQSGANGTRTAPSPPLLPTPCRGDTQQPFPPHRSTRLEQQSSWPCKPHCGTGPTGLGDAPRCASPGITPVGFPYPC